MLCITFVFPQRRGISGSDLLSISFSPTVLAQGGSYLTELNTFDAIVYNPAIGADKILFQSLSFSGLYGGEQTGGFSFIYKIPKIIGNHSVAINYLQAKRLELDEYINFQYIFSKEISKKHFFGLSVQSDIAPAADLIPFGLFANFVFVYKSKSYIKKNAGFGDFRFSLAIENIGLPIVYSSDQNDIVKPLSMRFGAGFNFLDIKDKKAGFQSGIGGDLGINFYPFNFLISGFFKMKAYKQDIFSITFRLGSFLSANLPRNQRLGLTDIFPLTGGVVMKINAKKRWIIFNYAVSRKNITEQNDILHAFTISFDFGIKDNVKPRLDYKNFDQGILNITQPIPEDFSKKL